jgi:iron(II)-dependent oxidoreductase
MCVDGVCVAGKAMDCDDGNPCTEVDTCVGGMCQPGVQKACGGGKGCVNGACVAVASAMVLLPAGSFLMGCVPGDADCDPNEKPQHKVTLDAYAIDVHEVTVAQYKACVDQDACSWPYNLDVPQVNWGKPGRAEHPVNEVTWSQAQAYCAWAGGRLPTEAEWERAARGGLPGKLYPWGSEPPTCAPGKPNSTIYREGGGDWVTESGCGSGTTAPVRTGMPNGYGMFDMAGNADEWVFDCWGKYPLGSVTNPTGPSFDEGCGRVTRGGDFSHKPQDLRASRHNDGGGPSFRSWQIGFRCARSAP